jgi:hypothetical protein
LVPQIKQIGADFDESLETRGQKAEIICGNQRYQQALILYRKRMVFGPAD